MPTDEEITQPSARVDPRAEPPAQPKTVQLPEVPAWAIELTKSVKGGFAEVNAQLEALKGSDKTLTDAVTELDTDFRDMRTRQRSAEEDIRRLSMRTKGTDETASKVDLEVAAQLAQERAAREALAAEHTETKRTVDAIEQKTDAQTVILNKITSLLDKPMVRRLGYAVSALLLAALTAGTGYLARGNVPAAQPTIIQVPAK